MKSSKISKLDPPKQLYGSCNQKFEGQFFGSYSPILLKMGSNKKLPSKITPPLKALQKETIRQEQKLNDYLSGAPTPNQTGEIKRIHDVIIINYTGRLKSNLESEIT